MSMDVHAIDDIYSFWESEKILKRGRWGIWLKCGQRCGVKGMVKAFINI
jgi:hypothetical protein